LISVGDHILVANALHAPSSPAVEYILSQTPGPASRHTLCFPTDPLHGTRKDEIL